MKWVQGVMEGRKGKRGEEGGMGKGLKGGREAFRKEGREGEREREREREGGRGRRRERPKTETPRHREIRTDH